MSGTDYGLDCEWDPSGTLLMGKALTNTIRDDAGLGVNHVGYAYDPLNRVTWVNRMR